MESAFFLISGWPSCPNLPENCTSAATCIWVVPVDGSVMVVSTFEVTPPPIRGSWACDVIDHFPASLSSLTVTPPTRLKPIGPTRTRIVPV
ncbi:uncharacterized protein METZ01_LOCUS125122 [marine metagenome]|uniref:Uncharacterized protein n=1 Tax=marine metagenome TaxID=408172 RepID=A0A381Y5G6_9ZZZZ